MTGTDIAPATPSAPVGIEAEILDFLAYLELERGLSRNTLEAYRSDLLQFGEFLRRRDLTLNATRHGDIAAFLSELASGTAERPPVAAATRTLSRGIRGPHSRRPKNAVIPEVPNISMRISGGHSFAMTGLNA